MQISKYIAHSGICSRRKADEIVTKGLVTINGELMTDVTYRVQQGDLIEYKDNAIKPEKHVYVLLNKPKGCVSTVDDERGGKTVLDCVSLPHIKRLYPVGRLDRMTTGLLILTNDGEFAQKLAHPSHGVTKKYHVVLGEPLAINLFEKLKNGVKLIDGFAKPDKIVFVEGSKRMQLLVELHSGKNRIIRRLFAHVGARVKSLDRFMYAHLNKKGLKAGDWRYLTAEELKELQANRHKLF